MTPLARMVVVGPEQMLLVLGGLVIAGGMIAIFVWTLMGGKPRK